MALSSTATDSPNFDESYGIHFFGNISHTISKLPQELPTQQVRSEILSVLWSVEVSALQNDEPQIIQNFKDSLEFLKWKYTQIPQTENERQLIEDDPLYKKIDLAFKLMCSDGVVTKKTLKILVEGFLQFINGHQLYHPVLREVERKLFPKSEVSNFPGYMQSILIAGGLLGVLYIWSTVLKNYQNKLKVPKVTITYGQKWEILVLTSWLQPWEKVKIIYTDPQGKTTVYGHEKCEASPDGIYIKCWVLKWVVAQPKAKAKKK